MIHPPQKDSGCKLGDCKPDSCKKYPYTNQPERLLSMLSVLEAVDRIKELKP